MIVINITITGGFAMYSDDKLEEKWSKFVKKLDEGNGNGGFYLKVDIVNFSERGDYESIETFVWTGNGWALDGNKMKVFTDENEVYTEIKKAKHQFDTISIDRQMIY